MNIVFIVVALIDMIFHCNCYWTLTECVVSQHTRCFIVTGPAGLLSWNFWINQSKLMKFCRKVYQTVIHQGL